MTPIDSGELHCLNVIDGKPLWRKPRQEDLYLACVYQGKVILVGRHGLRALRLADGETAWQLKYEGTAMPSGTGFASGAEYYVPLNTAEVAVVDLGLGRVSHSYRSRRGVVPGNLVCANGRVISQRAGAVEEFFQQTCRLTQTVGPLDFREQYERKPMTNVNTDRRTRSGAG